MVACPLCGQDVNWVTMAQAAELLSVSQVRVNQFIKAGRLPGANKHTPKYGAQPLWKIPIDSLMALYNIRRKEQGLT